MANETISPVSDLSYQNSFGTSTGFCVVGNNLFGLGGGPADGALRFTNVTVGNAVSLNFARLYYKYSTVGNSGTWAFQTYGIDEDNTADFSSSPFGRTQTSASLSYSEGQPTSGGAKSMEVQSIMQEIINRGGWSSGNAMGFLFFDNGSSDQVYAYAHATDSFLAYRTSAEPNFKPTPVSVSAPTIPSLQDFGIKISRTGKNVLTASEDDTFFTSGKNQFKVFSEGYYASSSVGYINIAHNLGYIPFVSVYAMSSVYGSHWVRLPQLESFEATPSYYVNDTNLTLYSSTTTDKFYYYIFLDQLAT